jgi:hypothetical protein
MKTHLLFLVLALGFLQACAPVRALRFDARHYAEGQSFQYRQTTRTETTITRPDGGGVQHSNETEIQDHTLTIAEIRPDGSTKMRRRFDRSRSTKQEGFNPVVETDSDSPDTSDLKARVLSKVVGAVVEYEVSPESRLYNFTGMEKVWAAIKNEIGVEPGAQLVLNTLEKSMGNDAMGQMDNETFMVYPMKKVRPGSHWKIRRKQPPMGLDVETVYTLKERNAQQAVVDTQVKIIADEKHPAELDMGVAKIKYLMKGGGKGKIVLEQPGGLTLSSYGELNMEGTMEIKIPFLAAQKLPVQIRSVITYIRQ